MEKALTIAAASCLLSVVHPVSRSYVDPTRVDFYEASSKLRVPHVTWTEDQSRISATLEVMAKWVELLRKEPRGPGATNAVMSTEMWASRVVLLMREKPRSNFETWAELGFTDAAREALARMLPQPPVEAKKALSREEEEEVSRLRYDLRFASGEDAKDIRDRICELTGESE